MINSIRPKGLLRVALSVLLVANVLVASAATRVEYFLNSDPGPGRAISVTPRAASAGYQDIDIDASALPYGINYIGLRAWVDGKWSTTTTWILVNPMPQYSNSYNLEYFWDKDPGLGSGTAISLPSAILPQPQPIEISADGLTPGRHILGVRVHSLTGWSQTMISTVYVNDDHTYEIIAAEYFWGSDPGQGKGTPIEITPGKEINLSDLEIEFPEEEAPEYVLSFRARTAKSWSHTTTTVIPHLYVSAISVTPPSQDLIRNDKMHLIAEVIPEDAFNNTVKWESSDERIATVDDEGNVTGLAPGEVTITATSTDSTDISASCLITVKTLSGAALAVDGNISVWAESGEIHISGSTPSQSVRIFSTSGLLAYEGSDTIIRGLSPGIYFVIVAGNAFKIQL